MKEQSTFKMEHSLGTSKASVLRTKTFPEKRKLEAEKLQKNHKTRVPVIVEKSAKCTLPAINKKKWIAFCGFPESMDGCRYLVPGDLTVGQFVYVIRQRIELDAKQTLVLFVGDIIPANGVISHFHETPLLNLTL